MKAFPIEIANSGIHFALNGRLNSGFKLLAISYNCPVALYKAMPINSAGETSGRLTHTWFNLLSPHYNWAYSDHLPEIDQPIDSSSGAQHESIVDSNHGRVSSFHPKSSLQFTWRGYSNRILRSRVKKQLDLHKLDLCKAILAHDTISISIALGPIFLECQGYSI